MSVVVRMEMPKNCGECRFRSDGWCYGIREFDPQPGPLDFEKRPSWCPIIGEAASPWHRVEEPPKEEGKYLVYDGRGNYYVVWWGQRLGWCYDPKFFCYWMPIEPPKEDA